MRTALKVAALVVALPLTLQAAQLVNGGQQVGVQQLVQGRVVGVRLGNGGGVLQIRSAPVVNNVGAANLGAAARVQNFAIGPATQFQLARGMNWMPANAAMLRPGQRVMVQAQGQQAVGVRIFAGNSHVGGRRGAYYVGRMPPVVTGNRTGQAPPLVSPAANTVGTNHRHTTASHGHAASKKR